MSGSPSGRLEPRERLDGPVVRCHILDIARMDCSDPRVRWESGIAPRYREKARGARTKDAALAELGVGVMLARILGVRSEDALVVDVFGKPRLADGRVEISVSHAGSLAVLACSRNPVGVDVEPLPVDVGKLHMLGLKRAYGNRLEWPGDCTLRELDGLCFCQLWTRAEAAVKLDGRGLRADPRANPQVLDDARFCSVEHEGHVVTAATREESRLEVVPFFL